MHDLSLTQKFEQLLPELEQIPDLEQSGAPLSALTTLHIGGTPLATLTCGSVDAAVAVIRLLDSHEIPLLVVGGGSNLVIADGELDFVAVVLACDDMELRPAEGLVRAEAGAVWDDVVAASVAAGLGGIECLSGIPGSAGATPVQNVGAYGAEVSDVLTAVRLLHRDSGEVEWVPASALDLAYRYSNLKFTGRAVVLEIELRLGTNGQSAPLRYGELAKRLGATEAGESRPVSDVRDAVLELRRGKGMVYEEHDHDTWSAGSFFTNPVVSQDKAAEIAAQFPGEKVPAYPVADEAHVKMSAAWLIQHAGFDKGFSLADADGQATLSSKHTLALTNRGNARTADIVDLARHIRAGVHTAFGITLETEPVWIGVAI